MEKKIYSSWAFTANESEKSGINNEIYHELKEKNKVYRSDFKSNLQDGVDCNFEEYDVVIGRQPGYLHSTYIVHKNSNNLSNLELALLCDCGNLCFGFRMEGKQIRINED